MTPGRSLFLEGVHYGVRIAVLVVGLLMLAVAARFLHAAFSERRWLLLFPGLLAPALLVLAGLAVFGTERVYGTERGLVVRRAGKWQTIPWGKVDQPRRTWWAFNPVLRVYEVSAEGDRVRFFAGAGELEQMAALRASSDG